MLRKFILFLDFVIVFVIIGFAWQGLEILIYKEIKPSYADDVVGIIFTWYVVYYYRGQMKIKSLKNKIEELEKRI